MSDFRAEATISENGELHLEHLPFRGGERVEVTVTRAGNGKADWPPGFFEATFGGIKDDSFKRHPQGDFEPRETIG